MPYRVDRGTVVSVNTNRSPKQLTAAIAVLVLATGCLFRRDPPPGATGERIYELQLCANCHGDAGEGGSLGPPLRGLDAHWEQGALARFFADPETFVERERRLADLAERYGRRMASYANLDEAERMRLAAFVLELTNGE